MRYATFEDACNEFLPQIERIARRQYVPGMDTDDIESEMLVVLWTAWQTHQPSKGELGVLWWSMWKNRKANLVAAFYAQKRPRTAPVDTPVLEAHGDAQQARTCPPPPWLDTTSQSVWARIARGDTATEIKRDMGLSQRAYYSRIAGMRNESIWEYLTSA